MPRGVFERTPEFRAKMAAARRGYKCTPEACANMGATKRREKHHNWKGGRRRQTCGYVYLLRPDHPFAGQKGYVLEHRVVMEESLGRILLPVEAVHHINEIRDDNRRENLMLFPSNKEHLQHHRNLKGDLRK